MDIITPIIIIAVYILLMRFVLPKMGIPTWMSNACDFQDDSRKNTEPEKENWMVIILEENFHADLWV